MLKLLRVNRTPPVKPVVGNANLLRVPDDAEETALLATTFSFFTPFGRFAGTRKSGIVFNRRRPA
jgi:hypothetical protein